MNDYMESTVAHVVYVYHFRFLSDTYEYCFIGQIVKGSTQAREKVSISTFAYQDKIHGTAWRR